jgi:hypothetical protein
VVCVRLSAGPDNVCEDLFPPQLRFFLTESGQAVVQRNEAWGKLVADGDESGARLMRTVTASLPGQKSKQHI